MKLNKIFKWGMIALILISVALLVWGFTVGFESNGGQAVETLLYWAYAMVGLAAFCWIVVGLFVSVKNNPKSLVKIGLVLVGAAVLCAIAYFLAAGKPAVGREGLDTAGVLKLTDTVLILTGIAAAGAILSIIVGEIRMAINNKK